MEGENTLYTISREQWRKWLQKNHTQKNEIWLVFFKKHTGKPGIPYDDAVEEAICFGWIDSILKRIDDQKYLRKFTPRTNHRKWSGLNKIRARKMIDAGRMTEGGWQKIGDLKILRPDNDTKSLNAGKIEIPPELVKVLSGNREARHFLNSLAPSYRKMYCGWVASARKPETREKRAREALLLLARKVKRFMK